MARLVDYNNPARINWNCERCGRETDVIIERSDGDFCEECDK